MSDSVTPRTAARQAPLSYTVSWSLLKFTFIELVTWLSNHLILFELSKELGAQLPCDTLKAFRLQPAEETVSGAEQERTGMEIPVVLSQGGQANSDYLSEQ